MTLNQRIARMFAALSVLSEAPASQRLYENVEGFAVDDGRALPLARGKADSKPPKGVHLTRDLRKPTGCPSPDEDLHGWFAWRVEHAKDERDLTATVVECEVRYDKRIHKPPAEMRAGSAGVAKVEDVEERDRRIAEDYDGLAPFEVRIIETARGGFVSDAAVRRCRASRGRDTEQGHRLERYRWETIPERRSLVAQLQSRFSQREIAKLLDPAVAVGTVANDAKVAA